MKEDGIRVMKAVWTKVKKRTKTAQKRSNKRFGKRG